MAKTLLTITFILTTLFTLSKGASGTYCISGKAYYSSGELIKNQTIMVDFNNVREETSVDSLGNYEIKIRWQTACPSGIRRSAIKLANERLNPKWIKLNCNGFEIRIENKWRKYAHIFPTDKQMITREQDLIFT
ncbi:MAG: hypothetical protein JKY18_13170 [Flavobacteriales bacterium]|nr:hypothetical protein [Flavobacteriales bacterium]